VFWKLYFLFLTVCEKKHNFSIRTKEKQFSFVIIFLELIVRKCWKDVGLGAVTNIAYITGVLMRSDEVSTAVSSSYSTYLGVALKLGLGNVI
jgi:hypothetical protein